MSKAITVQLEKPVKDLRDEQRNFRKKLEETLKKASKTKVNLLVSSNLLGAR
jgi:hypothetical protein